MLTDQESMNTHIHALFTHDTEESRLLLVNRARRFSGFCRKGIRKRCCGSMALLLQAAGAIPLYSTSWKNAALQAVARKLHLKCYGAHFHVT